MSEKFVSTITFFKSLHFIAIGLYCFSKAYSMLNFFILEIQD